ncbi:MAG TPA: TRAP transporter small permease [Hyphomicrobiaceae bacterium]|nr:TRAP transporter small permease [Hyphomicrobiaceae bacterium]
MVDRLSKYFGRLLEAWLIVLMVALTVIVVVAVIFRKLGNSLSWYDEVASIMLVWVTYYGSALAALRRKHIGFDGFLLGLPDGPRKAAFILSEVLIIGFFVLFTWGGWIVFQVLEGDGLVSLPWVPQQIAHSVIPIGGIVFIIAELLSLPAAWRAVSTGISLEHEEIEEEIRAAQREQAR